MSRDSRKGFAAVSCLEQRPDTMDRDGIDKTGIAGTFDIHLDMILAELGFGPASRVDAPSPSDAGSSATGVANDPGNTVMDAIRKFGLVLQPAKMRADSLVIDHVERPTAN